MNPSERVAQCQACGQVFPFKPKPSRPGKRPAYCSPACAVKAGPWSFRANEGTLARTFDTLRRD